MARVLQTIKDTTYSVPDQKSLFDIVKESLKNTSKSSKSHKCEIFFSLRSI